MTKPALQKCDLFIIQTRWTHEDGVEICYLHNEAHANVVQRLDSNGPTIPIGLFLHAPKLTQSTCFFHRLMLMTNKLITADPRAPTLMAIGTHLISGHFDEEGKSFCLTKIY